MDWLHSLKSIIKRSKCNLMKVEINKSKRILRMISFKFNLTYLRRRIVVWNSNRHWCNNKLILCQLVNKRILIILSLHLICLILTLLRTWEEPIEAIELLNKESLTIWTLIVKLILEETLVQQEITMIKLESIQATNLENVLTTLVRIYLLFHLMMEEEEMQEMKMKKKKQIMKLDKWYLTILKLEIFRKTT